MRSTPGATLLPGAGAARPGSSGGFIEARGGRLEYLHRPAPAGRPDLVFLHEGLGCVELWRDFPAAVAAATRSGMLAYSRLGYGRSDAAALPRAPDYMHREACGALPEVLAARACSDVVLVGHSDGASIALIHAGSASAWPGLRGLVLLAPHVFNESICVRAITAAAHAYRQGGLRQRLSAYHGERVDGAFWGWNRVWLSPPFQRWNIEDYLPGIRVPVLVVQGEDDPYGTLAQLDAIEAGCPAPVQRLVLERCGHAPHRDRRDATLAAVARFIDTL